MQVRVPFGPVAVCDAIAARTGLPVSRFSGGRTKWNRTRAGLAKTHANDAVCVGPTDRVAGAFGPTLLITCAGRGTRQRMMPNAYGFARGHRPRRKLAFGFRTGDLVRAEVPSGRKAGVHTGRVAIRTTGSFNIQTLNGTVQGISHRYCRGSPSSSAAVRVASRSWAASTVRTSRCPWTQPRIPSRVVPGGRSRNRAFKVPTLRR